MIDELTQNKDGKLVKKSDDSEVKNFSFAGPTLLTIPKGATLEQMVGAQARKHGFDAYLVSYDRLISATDAICSEPREVRAIMYFMYQ